MRSASRLFKKAIKAGVISGALNCGLGRSVFLDQAFCHPVRPRVACKRQKLTLCQTTVFPKTVWRAQVVVLSHFGVILRNR